MSVDLRKKIHIHPFHEISIPLAGFYETDEGLEENTTDRTNLADILTLMQKAKIPESEYGKVFIGLDYRRDNNDPSICCVYRKLKTPKEIEKETEERRAEIQAKIDAKAKVKEDKEEKKRKKEAVLKALTPEQKKVLGIK